MVSRPRGGLLDLEYDILESVVALQGAGEDAYGFGIARRLAGSDPTRDLIGHGTLYKALARLGAQGLLEARWEDADEPAGRPRRRLYEITADGAKELARRPALPLPAPRTALA
jgi:PadR family transcriptional regulator, regulatory protein PadR